MSELGMNFHHNHYHIDSSWGVFNKPTFMIWMSKNLRGFVWLGYAVCWLLEWTDSEFIIFFPEIPCNTFYSIGFTNINTQTFCVRESFINSTLRVSQVAKAEMCLCWRLRISWLIWRDPVRLSVSFSYHFQFKLIFE